MSEDVSTDIIKRTQKSLGKYVKKPPLTEKLLRKPPFRFLHDIVITVVRETNYLKGLFTEDELNSDKVKEKEAKIVFLNKLIEAVKNTTKTDLPVRSSKIVAGLESANTNLLLQTIANALESNVDSSSYVEKIKSGNYTSPLKIKKSTRAKEEKIKVSTKVVKEEVNKTPKAKKSTDNGTQKPKKSNTTLDSSSSRDSKTKNDKDDGKKNSNKKQISARKENIVSKEKISPKSNSIDSGRNIDVIKTEEAIKSENIQVRDTADNAVLDNKEFFKDSKAEKDTDEISPEAAKVNQNQIETVQVDQNQVETVHSENKNSTDILNYDDHNRSTVVRPKSARPKSVEKRIPSAARHNVVQPKINEDHSNISASGQSNLTQRPKSSLRPPSVRPSSARPGAPRLRPDSALPMKETVTMGNINVIVENVDLADDEETVVIETVSETSKETTDSLDVSSENKGQLVEQILEQIAEEEDGKKKSEIDWESEAFRNNDGTHKDVSNLRGLIQKLTKTANPLGKLINYLHEDIDAMHNELQIWSNTKRQLSDEILKQKKLSIDASKPLITHLDQLQQEIKKQQQEITLTHSNIIRNYMRIKELLTK